MQFLKKEYIPVIEGVLRERVIDSAYVHFRNKDCFVNTETARCLIRDCLSENFDGTLPGYPLLSFLSSPNSVEMELKNNELICRYNGDFQSILRIPVQKLQLQVEDFWSSGDSVISIPRDFVQKAVSLFAVYKAQAGISVPFVIDKLSKGMFLFDYVRMLGFGKIREPIFLSFRLLDILSGTGLEELSVKEQKNNFILNINNECVVQIAKNFDEIEKRKQLKSYEGLRQAMQKTAVLDTKSFLRAIKFSKNLSSEELFRFVSGKDFIEFRGEFFTTRVEARVFQKFDFKIEPKIFLALLSNEDIDNEMIISIYKNVVGFEFGNYFYLNAILQ